MITVSLLFALLTIAQTGAGSPPTTAVAAPGAPAPSRPCGAGQLALAGYVKDDAGRPVSGAVLSIVERETGARRVVGTGDRPDPASGTDLGKYCSGVIPPGRYSVTVGKSGYVRQQQGDVDLRHAAAGAHELDFVLYRDVAPARGPELVGVVAALILFLTSVWLARWYNVAWPARGPLAARLRTLEERVEHLADPAKKAAADGLLRIVARELAKQKEWTFVDFLFWSRGQEQQAWMQLHDVEQRLVELLPDDALDSLMAQLRTAEGEVRAIASPDAIALADNAKRMLEAQTLPTAAQARAHLSEALQFYYDHRDDMFWSLATWQNKTTWLLLAGAGMVLAVALVGGRVPLLVAGASGGLLSRLIRVHRAQEAPTDYGASWATLFFSPLIGALTGWFGVLLVVALNSLNVLGSVFHDVSWDDPLHPMTLATALLMGVSERLFDGLVGAVEAKAGVAKVETVSPVGTTTTVQAAGAPRSAAVQAAVVRAEKLTPTAAAAGDTVTVGMVKPFTAGTVKNLLLVGTDGKETTVGALKSGRADEIQFVVPTVASGEYQLKLVDADNNSHVEKTPALTVK